MPVAPCMRTLAANRRFAPTGLLLQLTAASRPARCRLPTRMCGIIGVFKHEGEANVEIYEGLLMLQHRGQDSGARHMRGCCTCMCCMCMCCEHVPRCMCHERANSVCSLHGAHCLLRLALKIRCCSSCCAHCCCRCTFVLMLPSPDLLPSPDQPLSASMVTTNWSTLHTYNCPPCVAH